MGILRRVLLLALVLLTSMAVKANEHNQTAADSVSLTGRRVAGHWVSVVTVNLASKRLVIKPLMARRGTRVNVHTLLGSRPPLAAITGAFFDMKSSLVVGSVAYQGRLLSEGAVGSTLALDHQRRAHLLPASGRLGRYVDWSAYSLAVSAGPTLVHRGRLAVNPSGEGFQDPGLFGPRRRTALGVTRNRRLLLVGVNEPVSLHSLAKIMRELGAVEALNMDGGSYATLYHRGQMVLQPHRALTNLVAIYEVDQERSVTPVSSAVQAVRHYQRGWENYYARRFVEARSHLAMAVALAPGQGRYRSGLAAAEAACGHRNAAVDQYLRASHLYLTQHKATQALALVRRAVALAPHRSDAQLALARVARQAGQQGLSRQAARAVLQRHPGHEGALTVLAVRVP